MYERFVDLSFLDDDHIIYVENDRIKLGVNLALGGAITYLAALDGKNLINSYDWADRYSSPFTVCRGPIIRRAWRSALTGHTAAGIRSPAGTPSATAAKCWNMPSMRIPSTSNANRCYGR